MGQGRAGSKRRKPNPINQAINQPLDVTQGIQRGTKIVTRKKTVHRVQTVHMTD